MERETKLEYHKLPPNDSYYIREYHRPDSDEPGTRRYRTGGGFDWAFVTSTEVWVKSKQKECRESYHRSYKTP